MLDVLALYIQVSDVVLIPVAEKSLIPEPKQQLRIIEDWGVMEPGRSACALPI